MRHIPRVILIHSCTLYPRTGVDAYTKPIYGAVVEINFVRCETVKHNAFTDTGESKDDRILLFYDCVNSEPVGKVFNKGDKIVFKSANYIVRDIKDFSPYHYEVILK